MRWILGIVVVMAGLAGCVDDTAAPAEVAPEKAAPTHVLVDAGEPDGLDAPTFAPLGAIASGGPVYGAGEPSAWAALDGSLLVAFPGCDRGFYLVSLPTDEETCEHGLVYRSTDDGASWTRLNRDGDGRYTDEGPAANGDADVAVDSIGTIYASNLGGGGIQFHRSTDNGTTWEYIGNIVNQTADPDDDPEAREGADRQWLAAAGPGHVINAWMRTSPNRDVAINTTFDGGETWTGPTYFGDGIGWLSTVQFAPDGQHAYIAYTQPLGSPAAVLYGSVECAMRVIITEDGGLSWTDVDTGARWHTMATGGHWSCVHMAPSLDVTGDGTVVVVYSIDSEHVFQGDTHIAPAIQTIMVLTSTDQGGNWSRPMPLWHSAISGADMPLPGSSIMPWVTGGAGDRFAITWLFAQNLGDQDYTGTIWDVMAAVVDGAPDDGDGILEPTASIVEAGVHAGGICTRGGACLLTGSDRAFLDFFEADLLPDGRLVVTYPHDLNPTKTIDIRVAIQDGGTPLLTRAP